MKKSDVLSKRDSEFHADLFRDNLNIDFEKKPIGYRNSMFIHNVARSTSTKAHFPSRST